MFVFFLIWTPGPCLNAQAEHHATLSRARLRWRSPATLNEYIIPSNIPWVFCNFCHVLLVFHSDGRPLGCHCKCHWRGFGKEPVQAWNLQVFQSNVNQASSPLFVSQCRKVKDFGQKFEFEFCFRRRSCHVYIWKGANSTAVAHVQAGIERLYPHKVPKNMSGPQHWKDVAGWQKPAT